jgi:uncharacterized membrane protein
MIHVQAAYDLAGVLFLGIAAIIALDARTPRRWLKAAFWGLFGFSFLFGERLGNVGNGFLVLALVALGGSGALSLKGVLAPSGPAPPTPSASIFLPILLVPLLTFAGTLLFPLVKIGGQPLVETKQVTVISMAGAVLVGLAVAMVRLRPAPLAPLHEGRRLMEFVGWAAVLPQLLAALGAVFALAGVGRAVGDLIGGWLPHDSRLAAVAVYCLGMAVFTMIMCNAFAAFPVLVAGIGAPLIVGRFGGEAAIVGAIGMLSGYCGTLMTPMASHNIIPTALLGLKPGAVIRAQAPTALIVLTANIVILDLLGFRA